MHFDNLDDFLTAVRSFHKRHPKAFIEIKDLPRELKMGCTATVGDATWEWYVPLIKFKEAPDNLKQIALKLVKTRTELYHLQDEYIDALFDRKGTE